MMRFITAVLLSLTALSGWSQERPYIVTGGAEIYYLERIRPGGTHQQGCIDGVRIGVDRIKRYGWYIGGDVLYATGPLRGKTPTGKELISELTDQIYELRFGYTLKQKRGKSPFFTPFIGWGYFKEINDFTPPSPLPCTFIDSFNYVTAGFLSGVNFNSLLSMGINFKLRFMQNGRSKVTDDPLFDDVTLLMKNEMHARLDLPIACRPCNTLFGVGFLLVPFFEYRHFGAREGFPFNFKETQFYLYGTRFALTYQF